MPFRVWEDEARSILTPVTGFLRDAGFTHSLSPARNCTFGCSYCYVPTMRVQGGLKPEDWRHWGEFTTFKSNAAELLRKALRPEQIIYCSPLTDPWQPAEQQRELMPEILRAVAERPPKSFVLQTRGPLITRDLPLLREAARATCLRVSFSLTTNREDVRRIFEPHCAPLEERIRAMRQMCDAGLSVSAALAPLLPCDPEALARLAVEVTNGPLVVDPFHVRTVKRSGATTREPAAAICRRYGWEEWLDPVFQTDVLAKIRRTAEMMGRAFGVGAAGFGLLACQL